MSTGQSGIQYCPPRILSIIVAPDITKCMQNTGGTEPRSTFEVYKAAAESEAQKRTSPGSGTDSEQEDPPSAGGGTGIRSLLLVLFFALTGSVFSHTGLFAAAATDIPVLIPQQHPVINEIVQGINQGFVELGYSSDRLKTTVMDGQGVAANFPTIIDAAIQKRPPLIISLTTGLSKTTVDRVAGAVPVVFSGVTDPVGAGIIPGIEDHGTVTGASDVWPVADQLALIRRVIPSSKTVGVIFRPSEPNSQFGMRLARAAAQKLGITLLERGTEDTREIGSVLDALLPQVDAMYIGPDNMTIEASKTIIERSAQARKPVFGGEPGTLEKGAVGVVSIRYLDLGRETAKLCDQILKGTPTPQVSVFVADRGVVGVNYNASALLGIEIPSEVRTIAVTTIGSYKPVRVATKVPILPIVVALGAIALILLVVFGMRRSQASSH